MESSTLSLGANKNWRRLTIVKRRLLFDRARHGAARQGEAGPGKAGQGVARQGHNAEDAWLMVFCFASGRPTDRTKGILPAPFKFVSVVGAQLTKSDWKFAGRSETSRRTITAAVTTSGYDKMMANWIYRAPDFRADAVDVEEADLEI